MSSNGDAASADMLLKSVSVQPNVWSRLSGTMRIGEVLEQIRNGAYRQSVGPLRRLYSNEDYELYGMRKARLPAVTFGGTFKEERKVSRLSQYNSVLVIDMDGLDGGRLGEVADALMGDTYVRSFWKSPSGRGYKGLVALEYSSDFEGVAVNDAHHRAFQRVHEYFIGKYEIDLDRSGSDVTRLCFVSDDEGLIVKGDSKCFNVDVDGLTGGNATVGTGRVSGGEKDHSNSTARARLLNPEGRNSPADRKEMASILKFLSKRRMSITANYEAWFRVGLAIASSFTYDVGERYYLRLCRLDGRQHDEIGSTKMLGYCYEHSRGELGFGTIVYYAQKRGYTHGRGSSPEGGRR